MPVEVAAHAGFCMGVRRAVKAACRVAGEGIPSCTLGEIIHNPQVVEMLRRRGVAPVGSAQEAAGRQVLIRSHGVDPQTLDSLREAGCTVHDRGESRQRGKDQRMGACAADRAHEQQTGRNFIRKRGRCPA